MNRDSQVREIRDNIVMALTPVVCQQLGTQLSQIIVGEFQKQEKLLFPLVVSKLDAMRTGIQAEIAQKMSITDHVIKENISNICKSKVRFENNDKTFFQCKIKMKITFDNFRTHLTYSEMRLPAE